MKTPNLIATYSEELIEGQRSQWAGIISQKEAMRTCARQQNWQQVIELSEAQQDTIDHFFSQGVCSGLFGQILQDVDDLKQFLTELKQEVQHQDEQKAVEQQSLVDLREDLNIKIHQDS